MEQHEARITNLKAQTFIRAPDNGIISERLTHLGDISAAGQVLFRLTRNGELELQAKVSADDLPQVSIGQQVSISQGDQSISGYVWMIAENVDPITLRTIPEILGHINLRQLQEYLGADPADSHKAITSFGC